MSVFELREHLTSDCEQYVSPREADLGLGIHHRFIRAIANLQARFESPDKCPFQYIITTTTSPPAELNTDESVRLRLNAANTHDLLFRVNLAEEAK